MTISIPDSVFNIYFEGMDEMFRIFGTSCFIYYPPLRENCPNCINNSMPGVGASNVYRAGGPYPFSNTTCPYCEGLGHKTSQTSETITVRAYFDGKSWAKFNPKIGIKDGDAVIIGYIKDLPKFQHISHIQLASNVGAHGPWNYEMSREPTPWGFQDKYFTTNVSRINGSD